MDDEHWQYFNWKNISSEASQRLTLYMKTTDSDKRVPEMETYAYWCAWAAHANAAACLLPTPPPHS
jgi:hypothetical protein